MLGCLLLFFLGYLYTQKPAYLKNWAAKLIVCGILPFLTLWNLTHLSSKDSLLAGFVFVLCSAVYLSVWWYRRNQLHALTYSYLNMGIIGYPFVVVLFGEAVSDVMITCFVASSLAGAVWGVFTLVDDSINGSSKWQSIVLAPPCMSAGLGLVWWVFDWPFQPWMATLYESSKQVLPYLGFFILGAWLREVPLERWHVRAAWRSMFKRLALYYSLMALLLLPVVAMHIHIPSAYYSVMFFIPWLPSATTIVIMETHYRRTGNSAATVASSTLVSLLFLTLGCVGKYVLEH